jgi:hypothetical protein
VGLVLYKGMQIMMKHLGTIIFTAYEKSVSAAALGSVFSGIYCRFGEAHFA